MTVVEIDQSGRIEFTSQDTVLAFSNGKQYKTIMIPSTVKQSCVRILREKGYSGNTFYLKLFSISLYILLKDHVAIFRRVIIDKEYIGNELLIKSDLLNFFYRSGYKIDPYIITFDLIGKKSLAHALALNTFRRKIKANRILTLEDLFHEFKP